MKELPYCGICKEQIVNAPSIGWYCPTIGCEGDWPQKANITWDYKTEADKLAVAEKEIASLKKLNIGLVDTISKINDIAFTQQKDIKELAEALSEALDESICHLNGIKDKATFDKYRALANKHLKD